MKGHHRNSLLMLMLAMVAIAVASEDTNIEDKPLQTETDSSPKTEEDKPLQTETDSSPKTEDGSVRLHFTGKGNPALKTESGSDDADQGSLPVSDSEDDGISLNVPSEGETGAPDGEELAKSNDEASRDKLFFWAQRSTTTKFKLSVFSSTTPYTCALVRSGGDCTGRRRRFMRRPINPLEDIPKNRQLDPSLEKEVNIISENSAPKAKGFLTVWTTSFSTKTITSYFSNTRVTISVSQACVAAGVAFAGCG